MLQYHGVLKREWGASAEPLPGHTLIKGEKEKTPAKKEAIEEAMTVTRL